MVEIGVCGSMKMGLDTCGSVLVAKIGTCGSTEISACGF